MNSFLQWPTKNAQQRNQSSCWVCEQLPSSSSLGSPWWLPLLQEGDWKAWKQYIQEEQATTKIQFYWFTTNANPKTWLVAHTINNTGHSILFCQSNYNWQSIRLLTRKILGIPPLELWVAMLRFGMALWVLPQNWDIWTSRHSYVRNRKSTLKRTSSTVPGIWEDIIITV